MNAHHSRRDLLKTGGALVVGFAFARVSYAGEAPPPAGPDQKRIDSWIAVHQDNTATLYVGKVELGQGNTTGLMQIAGEELDLGMDQMRVAPFERHSSDSSRRHQRISQADRRLISDVSRRAGRASSMRRRRCGTTRG